MIIFEDRIKSCDKNGSTVFLSTIMKLGGGGWPSGRVSDSGVRGRGFDPHSGQSVVSLSKIHLPPQEAVAPSRHD